MLWAGADRTPAQSSDTGPAASPGQLLGQELCFYKGAVSLLQPGRLTCTNLGFPMCCK